MIRAPRDWSYPGITPAGFDAVLSRVSSKTSGTICALTSSTASHAAASRNERYSFSPSFGIVVLEGYFKFPKGRGFMIAQILKMLKDQYDLGYIITQLKISQSMWDKLVKDLSPVSVDGGFVNIIGPDGSSVKISKNY